MKRHTPTPRRAAALLVALALLGCSAESTSGPRRVTSQRDASVDASGPSASGHANWINGAGDLLHRSFHARVMPSGVVEGSWVQHNSVTGLEIKGDIDCLQFRSLTEASLSGPIRESTEPVLVGRTGIFRVSDNGEGTNDASDQMSGLAITGFTVAQGLDCGTFVNPFFTPIESGNIQVHPQ